ncbi:MAG: hypothetical protein MJZ28_12880 [Paludibacteraceae bacterium]|nr:hypothetical protein [Paludibacteraceae bacterium]
MNVSFLLRQYSQDSENVSIDVFDAQTLNDVYKQVLQTMTAHFEIEVSVLQAMSYCFYEILDNVHIHSGKQSCSEFRRAMSLWAKYYCFGFLL